ncbi:glycosyltransferase family 1 protein [Atractiella rhizophila]|nr:glycosyltransferase family 1 protein [Atractiella rhizophila]
MGPPDSVPKTGPHILCTTIPLWGHCRCLIALSCSLLLRFPDYTISIILSPFLLEQANREIDKWYLSPTQCKSLRLIAANASDPPEPGVPLNLLSAAQRDLGSTLRRVLHSVEKETTFEDVNGVIHDFGIAVRKPCVIFEDCMGGAWGIRLKEEGLHILKVVDFISTSLYGWTQTPAGPEDGGMGNVPADAQALVSTSSNPSEQDLIGIMDTMMRNNPRFKDGMHRYPGFPDRYEFEQAPQAILESRIVAEALPEMLRLSNESDALIIHSIEEFEPPAGLKAGLRIHGKEGKKPLFLIGPQLAPSTWNSLPQHVTGIPPAFAHIGVNDQQDAEPDFNIEYLDDMQAKYGKRSVVYVSFGSIVWPITTPEIVRTIVTTLLSLDPPTPFLFATASPAASVDPELQKMAEKSGKGRFSKWVDQTRVLRHEAIGAFLTHGGLNGVMETMLCGIPMIVLPFGGDQPLTALHLSLNLKVGIELLQFRTGPQNTIAFRPDLVTGAEHTTIDQSDESRAQELKNALKLILKGEEGRKMRTTVEGWGKVFFDSARENGSAWRMIGKLDGWLKEQDKISNVF